MGMCNHPKILVQSAYESVVVQYLRLQIFCNKLFCYEKSNYFVVFSKFFVYEIYMNIQTTKYFGIGCCS